MDWKTKVAEAIKQLQSSLNARGTMEALSHLREAQGDVQAAVDAFDDARANEAT